jgi:electron transport complex protein RnfE
MDNAYRKITADGLWHNNPGLVQLLGLCPLLAVSGTVINALGLGIATTLVLTGSNVTVSGIRHWVRPELRIPVFVMVIASLVTVVELSMKAWFYELHQILGIFIARSFTDGLMMGLGFALVLVTLGAIREVIGQGTLFANANLMFGDGASWMTITLIEDYRGFLLAILPPGAFIGLGLLIAIKQRIDRRMKEAKAEVLEQIPEAAAKTAG